MTFKLKTLGILSVLLLTFSCANYAGNAKKVEPQPRMKAALAALNTAEAQLLKASKDKGGHRVAALKLIRDAKQHIREGIKHDNSNRK